MSTSTIYLDNNATTAPLPAVVEAMAECLAQCWGNPSSMHRIGQLAKARLAGARAEVAGLIGAAPAELVFTGSATEASHAAVLGTLNAERAPRHIVTSTVEHPATLRLLDHLAAQGTEVTRIGVDGQGGLDLDALRCALDRPTALLTLMWANNETGVCFPIEQIAHWTQARGIPFHVDAVQAVGRIPVDLRRIPIDLLSLSGHKLHGPKGIGALFIRKGGSWPPLLFGHQERRRRGGTENVPGIVGLGVAAAEARMALASVPARLAALRDGFEQALLARFPQAQIHGAAQLRVCNTSSVCFRGAAGDELLDRLDRAGVCASGGAACTAGAGEPSHVLLAMGRARADALASLRFSLSRLSTAAELEQTLGLLGRFLPALASHAA